jgi:transcriptional regulator with XRE-family HTH domain
MAPQKKDPARMSEHARRLRATRLAYGYTQHYMSTLMGSTTIGQAWENYESGRRRISIDHAMALCKQLGLTLDWFYFGDMRGLNPGIAHALRREQRIEAA